jgi:acyl-coenzyme A synthetase/AMP-(fatty) acid ligase
MAGSIAAIWLGPRPAHGERVVAFVSLRRGLVTDDQELRDHARPRLADFKIPEQIFFVNDLPKGITGKIQRRALKEMPPVAGFREASSLR